MPLVQLIIVAARYWRCLPIKLIARLNTNRSTNIGRKNATLSAILTAFQRHAVKHRKHTSNANQREKGIILTHGRNYSAPTHIPADGGAQAATTFRLPALDHLNLLGASSYLLSLPIAPILSRRAISDCSYRVALSHPPSLGLLIEFGLVNLLNHLRLIVSGGISNSRPCFLLDEQTSRYLPSTVVYLLKAGRMLDLHGRLIRCGFFCLMRDLVLVDVGTALSSFMVLHTFYFLEWVEFLVCGMINLRQIFYTSLSSTQT